VKADWLERMLTVYGAEFEGDAGYHVDKKARRPPGAAPPFAARTPGPPAP
jgi:hypothetical protein